jgi:hypothetical protein
VSENTKEVYKPGSQASLQTYRPYTFPLVAETKYPNLTAFHHGLQQALKRARLRIIRSLYRGEKGTSMVIQPLPYLALKSNNDQNAIIDIITLLEV